MNPMVPNKSNPDTLSAMLTLMADPKAYQAKLDEFNQQKSVADARIAAAKEADRQNVLKAEERLNEIKKAEAESNTRIAAANDKLATDTKELETKKQDVENKLEQLDRRKGICERWEAELAAKAELLKNVEQREIAIKEAENRFTKQIEEFTKDQAEFNIKLDELNTRQARLLNVINHMKVELGKV